MFAKHARLAAAVLPLLAAGFGLVGAAQAATWTGAAGDGNLVTGGNWDGGAYPTSGFNFINNGNTVTVNSALPGGGPPAMEFGFNHGDQSNVNNRSHLIVDSGASGSFGSTWVGTGSSALNVVAQQSTFTMNGGTFTVGNFTLGSGDATPATVRASTDHIATVNGGTFTIGALQVSAATNNNASADSTFLQTNGTVNATSVTISNTNAARTISGSPTAVHGLLKVTGGSLTSTNAVSMGSQATANGSALLVIEGGSFRINAGGNGTSTYPFTFTQGGNNQTYVDLAGGQLILDNWGGATPAAGTPWDATTLTSIPNADFRAFGQITGVGDPLGLLAFDSTSIPNFTVITAVPEPASLGLLGLGALGLLVRRRRWA